MKRVAVIGAGASGLMAACAAAEKGAVVTIFEKESKIGRKLAATGNGRCNISNMSISPHNFHGDRLFAERVLQLFTPADTAAFFYSIGLPFVEESGRLFPASLQASSVTKIFQYEIKRRGIELRLNRKAVDIVPAGKGFQVMTPGESAEYDAVILACGSCAFPNLGGSRMGYELAEKLGHRIIEPAPVIQPINITLKRLHQLEGIKRDVSLAVEVGGKQAGRFEGEILFTSYGISGPVSLAASRTVNENRGSDVRICVDLFPDRTSEELARMSEDIWKGGRKKTVFSLAGILRDRLPEFVCFYAGVDGEKRVESLSAAERKALLSALKRIELEPGKPRGFHEAVAAAGGVDTAEVDPETMMSRIADGLYITGELLNIDGDSGGYNLQFAWSSGAIAGNRSAL